MPRLMLLSFVSFLSIGLLGCMQDRYCFPDYQDSPIVSDVTRLQPYANILESSYVAADSLARALHQKQIPPESTILAASFVNIDNLSESSTLGRIISEQIASRLAQRNYSVLEMKLRHESVFIKEKEGEFVLSRELKNISSSLNGSEVLVGTYAVADRYVFVSARIVRSKDNTVIVGHDYQLVLNDVAKSLLK